MYGLKKEVFNDIINVIKNMKILNVFIFLDQEQEGIIMINQI